MSIFELASRKLEFAEAELLIQEECNRIVNACNPTALILFGSGARNSLKECSDLDFVAIFESVEQLEKGREEFYKTKSAQKWPVDLLFVTQDEFTMKSQTGGVFFVAAREGRVMFDKRIERSI